MGTNARPDRAAWLKAGDARCEVQPRTNGSAHRLVLLGAPGVGKGTQAEFLTERLGVCHLSTGDIFRNAKKAPAEDISPAMQCALNRMRAGELVTDEMVISLVAERADCLHCGGGLLLDGFPRTVAQAEALAKILSEKGMDLEAVLSYELPLESIVARLSGRRTCPKCQAVFHVTTKPPGRPNFCDHCGSALIQREDDRPEAIRVRMQVYEQSTAPLVDYYRRKGLLVSLDASGAPDEIFERTEKALAQRCADSR